MLKLLTLVMILVGCGAKDGASDKSAADSSHHSQLVADATALPTCDAAAEGWLVYVKAEAKFKACVDGSWGDVAAPTSTDSMIAEQWLCDASDDLDTGDDVVKVALAEVIKFQSGDYFISCNDVESNVEFTYTDSSSNSLVFMKGAKAVKDGAIGCLTLNTNSTFDLATHKITYKKSSDGVGQTIQCEAPSAP